jgi:hypothetical protein
MSTNFGAAAEDYAKYRVGFPLSVAPKIGRRDEPDDGACSAAYASCWIGHVCAGADRVECVCRIGPRQWDAGAGADARRDGARGGRPRGVWSSGIARRGGRVMLSWSSNSPVYLCVTPIDLRKSFEGLGALVECSSKV